MRDYRTLSASEKLEVDVSILREVPSGERLNEQNGHRWQEPENTLKHVHDGYYCAECFRTHYTCICDHEE